MILPIGFEKVHQSGGAELHVVLVLSKCLFGTWTGVRYPFNL